MAKVLSFEQYAAMKGCSRADLGEAGIHKAHTSISKKQWSRIVKNQSEKDKEWLVNRNRLRHEYEDEVTRGTIRPPRRMEKLRLTAAGHPDNASTQAAIRILKKLEQQEGE